MPADASAPAARGWPSPRRVALLALVAVAYVAGGRLGLSLALVNPSATAVWPPTGIAIAALLLLGRDAWPAVFAGAWLTNLLTGGAVPALGIAAGNTLEAWLAATLVARFAHGRHAFRRAGDVGRFAVLAGLLSTTASAGVGVATLLAAGLTTPAAAPAVALTWWLGDVAGAMLVAPFVLVWADRGARPARGGAGEAVLLAAVLAVLAGVVFMGLVGPREASQLRYLAIPPVLWAAGRFGGRGASTATVALSAAAVAGTLQSRGPFSDLPPNDALLFLQMFMGVLSGTGLMLSAALEERAASEAELRRARDELEESVQARTATLLAAQRVAKLGSWEWDLGAGHVTWSEEMYRIYGYGDARFDVDFERAMERVHPEDQQRIRDNMARRLREPTPGTMPPIEYRIVLPGGEERVLQGQGTYLPGPDGAPARVVGTVQDITERRRAEDTLRASEERFAKAFHASPAAMCISSLATGRILDANEAFARAAGLPRDAVLGRTSVELGLFAPADRRRLAGEVERSGLQRLVEVRVGGEARVWRLASQVVEVHGERCILSAIEDVTERERAEERVRRSQALLAEAERIAHIGSWEWDVARDVVTWSEEMHRIYGTDAAARTTYASFLAAVHADDRERVRGEVERALRTGQGFSFEHRIVRPDGEVRTLHARGHVAVDAQGRPVRMAGTGQDITERKQAEARLAQLQDLERLQELDAFKTQFLNAAAHELGTPLTPIRLQLDLLREADLDPKARRSVDILERNTRRLIDLVRDILEAARLQSGRLGVRPRRMELGPVLREAAEAFEEPARRAGLTLEMRVEAGLWVEADPDRVVQVALNLLTNAWKFTPEGGRIAIEARRDGGEVRVEVRDSGIGMTAEQRERLFQPFSQVHGQTLSSRGTGLGLYISKGLVELLGGRVWAESDGPGRGSTFGFALPAASAVPAEQAQAGSKR